MHIQHCNLKYLTICCLEQHKDSAVKNPWRHLHDFRQSVSKVQSKTKWFIYFNKNATHNKKRKAEKKNVKNILIFYLYENILL